MTGSFSHFTAIPLTALSKEMGEGQSLNSEYDKISPMNDNWSLFHVNYSGCIREIDKLETHFRNRMGKNCCRIMQHFSCR